MHRLIATLLLLLMAVPLQAQCRGDNLLLTMPADRRAALMAETDKVPHPRGNLWRATRGDAEVHLVGTYHFDDPRHAATMDRLLPLIEQAATVLVEAGPEEERALVAHLARNPSMLMITTGPTLLEQLPPEDWNALSAALSQRGIPGMMAAKLQPWYVNLLLAVPACAHARVEDAGGLDGMVIEAAARADVPLRALEPYDTVFTLFDLMMPAEQLEMIRATLSYEPRSEDFSRTLTEAYFDEESRLIWEFMRAESSALAGYTPAQIDHEFARMEEVLMSARNRNWMPVIEAAAAEGPVFAAFGALHLSGQDGVLALMERAGYRLERLPF